MRKTRLLALLFLALVRTAVVADVYAETPLRMVTAIVQTSALQEVLERLRDFGAAHGFAVQISQSSPDPEDLLLQMQRIDMKIIGAASEAEVTDMKYVIAFYRNGDDSVPERTFSKVAADVREALRAMQGVISVETE